VLNVPLCGALPLSDQWTKSHALRARPRSPGCTRVILPRLIHNVRYVGPRESSPTALTVAWCVSAGAALALHSLGGWFQSAVAQIGLACAFGGAAGNLIDILRYPRVTDFIDLKWWPVFNLADVAIVGGLLVAFWPEL
jgi:Signal peptidase (SPase) II